MAAQELLTTVRDRLGDLAPEWDALVAAQDLPSPFLRSWWLDHASSGAPAIICCFDGTELIGGAAFELDRPGRGPASLERVRALGQGNLAPDHLDLITAAGRAGDVAHAVLQWLHRPGSRIVDLDGLAGEGTLARALALDEIDRTVAPYGDLTVGLDAYLAGRPGQVRSTIKRTGKRFDRDGIALRRVEDDDIERALEALADLHDGRWADESAFLRGWDRFAAAARAGHRLGDVVIHELVRDGDVVATELDLTLGGRVAFYQAGRRTDRELRGSGSVLRSKVIAWASEQGATEYDLLRGDEPYKAEWSTGARQLVRCRFGVGPLGRAVISAHGLRVRGEALRARLRPVRERLSPGPSSPDRGAPPEQSG